MVQFHLGLSLFIVTDIFVQDAQGSESQPRTLSGYQPQLKVPLWRPLHSRTIVVVMNMNTQSGFAVTGASG